MTDTLDAVAPHGSMNPFAVSATALLLAAFWAVTPLAAAEYVTHVDRVPDSRMSVPSYNASNPLSAAYTDPQFGTTVVRVSGNPGQPILLDGTDDSGADWQRHTCHQYSSTDTAWNADGSLLVLDGCQNRGGLLLDGNTFRVLRVGLDSIHGARMWSRTDKEKMYAIGGNSVVEYFPRTNRAVTKWTFEGYSSFEFHGQGRQFAIDGKTIAVEAKKGGSLVTFSLNLETGKKGPDITISARDSAGQLYNDGVSLSASGKYIRVGYGYGGINYDLYDAATGERVFEYRGNFRLKHKDNYLLNGRDYLIAPVSGSSPLRLVRFDILTGEITELDTRLGAPNHVSTRNYLDPRFAIVSYDDGRTSSHLTLEIVAVRIDGNEKNVVRRLAHHNSYRNTYSNEPHPNPSPDGKKIVFASNWGGVLGADANGPTSVYVILLPDWDTPIDNSGVTCNLLTSQSQVPGNWSSPFNSISSTGEPLLSAECGTNGVTVTAGSDAGVQYVYETGYEYKDGTWEPFEFTGSRRDGPWIIGPATARLARTEAELSRNNFVAAYVCLWNGTGWKCGCSNSACKQSYWQLQGFRR